MKYLILVLMVAISSHISAEPKKKGSFYKDEGRGWFWYEEPEFEEIEEEIKKKAPVEAKKAKDIAMKSYDGPPAFSTAWIKTQLPKLQQKAMDNPTEFNVASFMYVNRMMMDKAHNFSNAFAELSKKDPLLSENSRYPFDSMAKAAMLRDADKAKKEAIRLTNDKYAIWYFYDEKCSHCKRQVTPLRTFANKNEVMFEVVYKGAKPEIPGVNKYRKDKGHFESLGLKAYPALVLVRPPNDFNVLSEGVVTASEIEARLLVAISDMGMINDELMAQIKPMDKGIVSAKDMNLMAGSNIDPDDPKSWMPVLRAAMGGVEGGLSINDPNYYNNENEEDEKNEAN